MVDKVCIINDTTAVVTYVDRHSLTLSSDYNIRDFVQWYLEDRKHNPFDEHRRALVASIEDTTEININDELRKPLSRT